MTVTEWEERAEACRLDGVPLTIGPDEYAALVRLCLARDPSTVAGQTDALFGVRLVVA